MHMAQLTPLPLTVSCFSKIKIAFTFLVPVHPESTGKMAIKRVCVCVRGKEKKEMACKNRVVGCWCGCLSGARCRLAYGPADDTATHCLMLQ